MIIQTKKSIFKKEQLETPIKIFEENKNIVQIDKHGFEYINWLDIPTKYDDETKYISKVIEDYAPVINLYSTTQHGNSLKFILITKQHGNMSKKWSKNIGWNRLNICIPLNKTIGGFYNFTGVKTSMIPGSLLFFDGVEDWWSIDKVKNPCYRLIFRFHNDDPHLRYTRQNEGIQL